MSPLSSVHPFSRLALAGGLSLLIAGLSWLMFGLAGNRAGMISLPVVGGAEIEVLADGQKPETIEDVVSVPESGWQAWTQAGYFVAKAKEATWLRVTLINQKDTSSHGVLADSEYLTDRIDAWMHAADGSWQKWRSGELVQGKDKPLWSRTAAFPVTVPAKDRKVVFLCATDFYDAYLWLRWWPRAEDFYRAQIRDTLAEAVCYGGLAALLIYNLVLWLRLRFPDTGCYVLYAGAMGVFNFATNGGLGLLGLVMGSPLKEMIMGGALALSGVFLVQFARVFLGTPGIMPDVDWWLRRGRAVLVTLAMSAVFMPWMNVLLWFNLIVGVVTLAHLLLLGVALASWRRGVRHARYFVAAFGLLFAGGLPAAVTWLEQDMQAWAAMSLLAGSLLEMLMLSFAVADRFVQTQRQLVEETEQRRMIEQTYADELEIEVQARTRELQEANADKDRMLSVIGHDLRSPLTGLMRAADDAPGAFAREASRTGRALLLLIEDLVLWARLRAGTRVEAVHSASAVLASAVALHRSLAEHGGIALETEMPAEELRVVTDLVLAQTLVRNLLANALKFAQAHVTLRLEAVGDGVRFTVGNDGASPPPEIMARFALGENEPLSASNGLGLRLCREICRALGYRLELGMAADGTTEFHFTLPLATTSRS